MIDVPGVTYNPSNLGGAVLIDGKDALTYYSADLIDWSCNAGDVESSFRRSTGKQGFDLYDFDFAAGTLKLRFYVCGDSRYGMLLNVNKLIAAAKSCDVCMQEDPSIYSAVLDSYSFEYTDVEWYGLVTLELQAVRHKALEKVTASSTKSLSVLNEGAVSSGLSIKFKCVTAQSRVVISVASSSGTQSFTFSNVLAGVLYDVNGINGTVTDETGANKILSTDLIRFPKVNPGLNTVSSTVALAWELSFYPTFEI